MKALLFLPALLALLLASCSTVSVDTNRDAEADFSKYRSYSLAPARRGETMGPASVNAMRDGLRTGLAARGVREVSGSGADLSVVPHVFSKDKVSVRQYSDWGYGYGAGWPYRYGSYGMWRGAPVTYTDVRHYTQGTLVLDFVDNRTRKLVFRGRGTGTIGSAEGNARKVAEAVRRITAQYPAPGGS